MHKFLLIISIAIFSLSCNKEKERMTVIKDCTGTYLRNSEGLDFFVCNEEELAAFASEEKVKVDIETVTECYGLGEEITCTQSHIYETTVEVLKVF